PFPPARGSGSTAGGSHGQAGMVPPMSYAGRGSSMQRCLKMDRLLVVEDEERSRASLEKLLKLSGYAVEAAATVERGKALARWQPHGVILDLSLRDGGGEELLRPIRQEALPIRVAVVSGSADGDRLASLERLNPDLFLLKPIRFSALLHWLDS